MKVCFKCGAAKPLSEYYRHKGMKDGHLNKCKKCARTDVIVHRSENESVREYDRKRGKRQTSEDSRQYRLANPKKYKAQTWVNNAVRDGRLVKADSCEVCNGTFQIEGHHDDYDQPQVVRWLCSRCHSLWHSAFGEAKNPF
jgi:hypothetical protein